MGNRHLSPWQLLETQTGVYFPYGPGKTTGSAKAVSILSLWGTVILSSSGGKRWMVQGQKGPMTVPSASL